MTTTIPAPTHAPTTHTDGATCEHCLVPAPKSKSAAIAWTIAALATTLLILVYFLGVGSSRGTLVAATGFGLAGILLCPIVMGGMMWLMMRKQH